MTEIGVRELKAHASEVIREVKENRAHYIVTHRGRSVAAIIPLEELGAEIQQDDAAWDELVALGRRIGQGWQSHQTSTEALSETRR
jgi:prevent-host-death family protein